MVQPHGNSVAQKFGYNGVEYNESLGLNLHEMDLRLYDPAIGRFNGIDPVTHHSQGTSVAFDNNPVFWADPSGADSETEPWKDKTFADMTGAWTSGANTGGNGPGDPPTTLYSGAGTAVGEDVSNLLDEVVVGGKSGAVQSRGYSTEVGPYEWGGTSHEYYSRYGDSYDSATWGSYVSKMSQLEKDRRNMQKLKTFVDRFSMVASVTAFSFGAPNLAVPRGFNLKFTSSSSSSINWVKVNLDNLADLDGVAGIYKFPHAGRGMKIYTGQSGNLFNRISTHISSNSVGGNIYYSPMASSTKLAREIAETRHIISIVRGNIGNSANLRYPVSFARAKRLGLNLYE